MDKRERIEAHGNALLEIFPNAKVKDPANLCFILDALERKGHKLAEDRCSVPMTEVEETERIESIERALDTILNPGDIPVFLNGDPRGYALKIEAEWMHANVIPSKHSLHTDFGGYGIIAPDFSDDD